MRESEQEQEMEEERQKRQEVTRGGSSRDS